MTYEYAVISLSRSEPNSWDKEARKEAERTLNMLGAEGWKLVSVVGRKAFISREIA